MADSPLSAAGACDYDWIVVGSGFGGSVAALRLAEKGYKVAVLECGRRVADADFPASSWHIGRFFWAPALGLRGISRVSLFKDILIGSGAGVGGGSLVYANTLYRANPAFFAHPQWAGLADWGALLAPHYETAERMLGVQTVPWESENQKLLRAMGEHFGAADTFRRTPCAVYFGAAGVTVPDPYFGGAGPDRTGCTRCGGCTTGCNVGAKNTLVKNYLWFAEKLGVDVLPDTEVADIRSLDDDGEAGYVVTTRRPGAWFGGEGRRLRARGVVVSAGALGTNRLLASCKHGGGLPRLSDRLGQLVRTNSESILAVTLPDATRKVTHDVSISASIHVSHDTHIELVSYGDHASYMKFFFTLLTGNGTRLTRPLLLLAQVLRHPLRFLKSLSPVGWSHRSAILLVMQPLDNALAFVAKKRRFGRGVRLATEQHADKPNPTFIAEGNAAAAWLAQHTGGIAQSMVPEALANIPTTAHILGGAVIGGDGARGVVDCEGRAFGYRNLIVCDGSIMPANPGVNPSLTIAALAEHVMSSVLPAAGPRQ
ncbi:GMC family oxidoreductase [Sulfuritalea sp.]|uniref:FAD-dependent oxidoreductase n=1 Tax=Sulfuritalea sp. TaxID=2480090 RepID=UPI001ACB9CEC|nr:GMC family oxidoreductase [Sulfuritalea sp.]MBN8476375.1 GMC family oxidoreductase [Sulfuritalea sp.]